MASGGMRAWLAAAGGPGLGKGRRPPRQCNVDMAVATAVKTGCGCWSWRHAVVDELLQRPFESFKVNNHAGMAECSENTVVRPKAAQATFATLNRPSPGDETPS